MDPERLIGPDWLNADRYDVVATMAAPTPREAVPALVQALLADRFKLKIHPREQRNAGVCSDSRRRKGSR